MDKVLLYITASSRKEADKIGALLVEERLAACVNIIEGMSSIYRWEGRIHMETEVVVIAKTVADLIEKLSLRVKSIHSYMVPCIVSLPITGGNPDFLKWIEDETVNNGNDSVSHSR
jgi:periplasmic divalent cation tolerance protein